MNPLEVLAAGAGDWRGVNTLQDPHTGRPEESPTTAAVVPILGGRFVRVDYTWGHQGKPQEGSLLVGFDPKSGAVTGHWVDSWHMGRLVLAGVGAANPDGTIALRGSFAAPPGPDWGWRIDITPEPLRITHTCIDPDGTEDRAAEGVYERARGAVFRAVGPIGDTDTAALPVRAIGPAVGYSTQCLGFALVSRDATTARLRRDDVTIGLAVNGGDPEQASCWFAVDDVAALHREFAARGIDPGAIVEQEYGGKPHRVFFAKEPHGVCFCFTQPVD